MENNKKIYLFCGAEINDAKKCRFCGKWLEEGNEIHYFKILLILVGLLMFTSPVLAENWVGVGGARPSLDATKEPDFGPYMRELQRRIKMNWSPPRGNENKQVVVLLKIAKDGRLLSCSIFKSSGVSKLDNAALNAVNLAAPFRPLPPEYKSQSLDIQFTFDYGFCSKFDIGHF